MRMTLVAALAVVVSACSSGGGSADEPSSRGEWRRAIIEEGIDWEGASSDPDWSIGQYQDRMVDLCETDDGDLGYQVVALAPWLEDVRFNFGHACPDRLPDLERAIDAQLCEMKRDELGEALGEQYDRECLP